LNYCTNFKNDAFSKSLIEEVLSGNYEPEKVLRVEISKPNGGIRLLGIPTVLDRLV